MKEKAQALRAYSDYLAQTPPRSLERLAQTYQTQTEPGPPTRVLSTLKQWSTEHRWQERVLEHERQIAQEAAKKARQQRLQVVRAARGKGVEALALLTPAELAWLPSALVGLLEYADCCERNDMGALATGMRRGELLGLRWQDVDWERGTVSVRQTVTVLKGASHIGPPKTKSARRGITVQPEVLDALKEHRRAQNERRLAVGPSWQDHDLVFSTGIGTPINPGNLDRDFYRLVGRAGVPRIRIHDLRHTNVTLTLRETADIKAVSQRVGHANVSITLGTYAHVLPDQHQEVAKKVGRALFGQRAQDVV